jgi:hypothetical protein
MQREAAALMEADRHQHFFSYPSVELGDRLLK